MLRYQVIDPLVLPRPADFSITCSAIQVLGNAGRTADEVAHELVPPPDALRLLLRLARFALFFKRLRLLRGGNDPPRRVLPRPADVCIGCRWHVAPFSQKTVTIRHSIVVAVLSIARQIVKLFLAHVRIGSDFGDDRFRAVAVVHHEEDVRLSLACIPSRIRVFFIESYPCNGDEAVALVVRDKTFAITIQFRAACRDCLRNHPVHSKVRFILRLILKYAFNVTAICEYKSDSASTVHECQLAGKIFRTLRRDAPAVFCVGITCGVKRRRKSGPVIVEAIQLRRNNAAFVKCLGKAFAYSPSRKSLISSSVTPRFRILATSSVRSGASFRNSSISSVAVIPFASILILIIGKISSVVNIRLCARCFSPRFLIGLFHLCQICIGLLRRWNAARLLRHLRKRLCDLVDGNTPCGDVL